MSFTKFWQVRKNGEVVNLFFVTKKSALAWIADQQDPENYTILKFSQF